MSEHRDQYVRVVSERMAYVHDGIAFIADVLSDVSLPSDKQEWGNRAKERLWSVYEGLAADVGLTGA